MLVPKELDFLLMKEFNIIYIIQNVSKNEKSKDIKRLFTRNYKYEYVYIITNCGK